MLGCGLIGRQCLDGTNALALAHDLLDQGDRLCVRPLRPRTHVLIDDAQQLDLLVSIEHADAAREPLQRTHEAALLEHALEAFRGAHCITA